MYKGKTFKDDEQIFYCQSVKNRCSQINVVKFLTCIFCFSDENDNDFKFKKCY